MMKCDINYYDPQPPGYYTTKTVIDNFIIRYSLPACRQTGSILINTLIISHSPSMPLQISFPAMAGAVFVEVNSHG